ncbi:hypothetical protein [Klebsiella michiganensis]|uniref:hypothetical protein n=1 Tax=Klebsiella michiganensis TaxID=1134687 RepID=UPI003A4C5F63
MTQKADENINILAFSRRRLLSQSNLSGESEEWPGDYRQATLRQRFLHHLRSYWDVHRYWKAPQVADRAAAIAGETLATLGFSLSARCPES